FQHRACRHASVHLLAVPARKAAAARSCVKHVEPQPHAADSTRVYQPRTGRSVSLQRFFLPRRLMLWRPILLSCAATRAWGATGTPRHQTTVSHVAEVS